MATGCFTSSADPGATEPNGMIILVWIGAVSLAIGVITLGVGLLTAPNRPVATGVLSEEAPARVR